MSNDTVLTSANDGIFTITLNRPARRNAVDGPTADALRRAFTEFEESDALKVAILCGAGGNFCAGADLGRGGQIMVVNPSLPVNSVAEFVGEVCALVAVRLPCF